MAGTVARTAGDVGSGGREGGIQIRIPPFAGTRASGKGGGEGDDVARGAGEEWGRDVERRRRRGGGWSSGFNGRR
uniref:DUF834 domain-containing protein n=1 Tax=Oryza meridionalis TaxID=40149 RepID=A0A0E0DDD2_9ORYZ